VLAFLYLSWSIVKSLIVAIVLALMIWPWVTRLASAVGPRGWMLPRPIAVALIYVLTFAAGGVVVWITLTSLVPIVDQFIAAYPEQTAFLRAYLEPFRGGSLASGAAKVVGAVAQQTAATGGAAGTSGGASNASGQPAPVSIGALAFGLFGGLVSTALVLIFTFFLLLEGDRFAEWLLLFLPRDRRAHAREIGLTIRDRISRWVLGTAIYSLTSALIVGGGMWLLRIPSPYLYGIGAATLALIPGLGPASVTVLALIVALGLSAWQPVAVALFGIVLYVLDATVIAPKIFGDMLRLPMFVVFLAILLGGELLGVWGAIVALPTAAACESVIRDYMKRRAKAT
jgi:predicted PurR-regulated permease PerM